ncbi:MAG: hypothetical protein ACM3X6_06480 [Patescibacteria group bacterium]
MLKRQGFCLVKSRRRDPRAIDYGGYMIVNESNVVVAGELNTGWVLSLDSVERFALGKGLARQGPLPTEGCGQGAGGFRGR